MPGTFKNILIIVLLIIAIAHFFPDTYDAGKNWIVDKFKGIGGTQNEKIPTYTNTNLSQFNINETNNQEVSS